MFLLDVCLPKLQGQACSLSGTKGDELVLEECEAILDPWRCLLDTRGRI